MPSLVSSVHPSRTPLESPFIKVRWLCCSFVQYYAYGYYYRCLILDYKIVLQSEREKQPRINTPPRPCHSCGSFCMEIHKEIEFSRAFRNSQGSHALHFRFRFRVERAVLKGRGRAMHRNAQEFTNLFANKRKNWAQQGGLQLFSRLFSPFFVHSRISRNSRG